ncbi:acylneuraminate cytidylyltransferase [Rheinheimera sp. SA_1]|uniref:acylneuraminate cytidylyltransferase family protein n=1 Tax=Rheinheimera sp. SA_1 TaxID=1827365 RepID=UPI000800292D|nr:acylneuraminate cytidylyltransferase family protein [Rheinheimera sp. SA_1]OBP15398.1 acylneuraminate cytidylyltransferase [Rheinheimera sp. SA_1]
MSSYAFIFARGGSKGLPRKNIKLLNNKPLICYSIETAKAVEGIQHVFVSTDDDEIATIAQSAGALLIPRPAELATDTSAEWLSWRHAVCWVREQVGDFDTFISLPATSPLRAIEDVQAAIDKFAQSDADICIAVTPASRNPYFNMVKTTVEGRVEVVCDSSGFDRRQDAPQVFDITTVVYVTTPEFIMSADRVFAGKVVAIEVPKERAVDIDDHYDFLVAEALMKEAGHVA